LDPLSKSSRRHLNENEIPEVKRGLLLRLRELYNSGEDLEAAEIAFRALFRLSRDEPGRPKYPKLTREYLEYYLEYHLDE